MELTEQQIQEFIDAWQADFGEVLSPDDARRETTRLLNFLRTIEEGLTATAARAKAQEIANNPTGLVALRAAWGKRSCH